MTYADLVAMVRGSPSGTTEHMLLSHGATGEQLRRLEEEGVAYSKARHMDKPKMVIRWYFPNE